MSYSPLFPLQLLMSDQYLPFSRQTHESTFPPAVDNCYHYLITVFPFELLQYSQTLTWIRLLDSLALSNVPSSTILVDTASSLTEVYSNNPGIGTQASQTKARPYLCPREPISDVVDRKPCPCCRHVRAVCPSCRSRRRGPRVYVGSIDRSSSAVLSKSRDLPNKC